MSDPVPCPCATRRSCRGPLIRVLASRCCPGTVISLIVNRRGRRANGLRCVCRSQKQSCAGASRCIQGLLAEYTLTIL
eukprot:5354733-Prymnesium_polylepis.1